MDPIELIARRAVQATRVPEIQVSVLTDAEKLCLEKEKNSVELNGSGGGLGLGAHLEAVRDAKVESFHRRLAVQRSKRNNPSEQRREAARAEKAKRKKLKKRGH
ncbi:MAG TPA: hypothetical protein PLS53_10940 [Thermoanaerobaculaceae bacterium]|nr:hypothetical protein [Thermoanaerobaculaceae bacterium]